MRDDITDGELMRRMGQGDATAFDTLFVRHQRAVFNYTVRMTDDRALAEDLTQECFLRVWRARHVYRPAAQFRTWLFTIARRLVLDERKRPGLDLTPAAEEVAGGAEPQEAVLAGELERVLGDVLNALPPEFREVVVLRDMERMSYQQIAAVIGCPTGTVKSRLSTARARLLAAAREWMGER